MLFKKHLFAKVMDGTKTQTRRLSTQNYKVGKTYGATCRRYQKSQAHIKLTRKTPQRLGDITIEDAKAEGFKTVEEFKQAWIECYGTWNPDQIVNAYEFHKIGGTVQP
ncbi:MAG: ASCH domain-containing protein [Candidatus Bathyarchaeota archaeon]|nr:ASCH domain-containing protein [Candidatus Bathyarchaeota archaeon]